MKWGIAFLSVMIGYVLHNTSISAQQPSVRKADYPIEDIFLDRWSPRAMSGAAVSRAELMRLFEAARWAPSAYNNQPWRFIYAFRGSPAWDKLFTSLASANQVWAKNASVLVLVISHNRSDHHGKPLTTHSFDTGAACEHFALQGSAQGLVVHCLSGFDHAAARKEFSIPAAYDIEVIFCVGRPGGRHLLPENLQKREVPSGRHKLSNFVFENEFTPAQQGDVQKS